MFNQREQKKYKKVTADLYLIEYLGIAKII